MTTADARVERRVRRMLAWFPRSWRERYGEEFSELVRLAIRDGRGGVGLTVDVLRESLAVRLAPFRRREVIGVLCWSLCWVPLVALGLVPMILTLTGSPAGGLFVPRSLPAPYHWAAMSAMVAAGSLMLATAIRTPGLVATAFGRGCRTKGASGASPG